MIEDVTMLLSNTLMAMTPILLAALGEILTEKSGVVNIGLEGIMLLSGLLATIATFVTGDPYLGALAGVATGALSGVLHGLVGVYLRGDQIIVGVGFNSVAMGLSVMIMLSLWGSYSNSPPVAKIPSLIIRIGENAHLTIYPISVLALVTAVASWFLLEKTRWGLKLKACGEDPRAVEAMGVNVLLTRFLATVIGGSLAGLGGAYMVVGWTGSYNRGMSAGRGFIALANVAFSNWNPMLAIVGALVFGFFDALKTYLPLKLQLTTGGVVTAESYLFFTLPYLATLVVVTVMSRRVRPPRALGKPYVKE